MRWLEWPRPSRLSTAGAATPLPGTRQVPASYARLGTFDPSGSTPRPDIHSGGFDVDERSIEIGVRLLVTAALAERDRLASEA